MVNRREKMDTAKLTTVKLCKMTRAYLDEMREPYRFSLSYMLNLVIMEHATDRHKEYSINKPAPRGCPRIHPVRPAKVEWEQSQPAYKEEGEESNAEPY